MYGRQGHFRFARTSVVRTPQHLMHVETWTHRRAPIGTPPTRSFLPLDFALSCNLLCLQPLPGGGVLGKPSPSLSAQSPKRQRNPVFCRRWNRMLGNIGCLPIDLRSESRWPMLGRLGAQRSLTPPKPHNNNKTSAHGRLITASLASARRCPRL